MIAPTNLQPVTNFSNAIRARLKNVMAFKKHLKDDAALAEELAKSVTHALGEADHHNIEVTAEEAYQWLAAQDMPRDDNRGDDIYDALLEVLGIGGSVVAQFNLLHAAALAAIEAQETLTQERTEALPLPAKGAARKALAHAGPVFGVGSYGKVGGGGNAHSDLSPCWETKVFPAVPPRLILTDNNYAKRYGHMGPEEWKDIADKTENLFELLCCLRRMIEPRRHVFSRNYLGAESRTDSITSSSRNNEHGKAFPYYKVDTIETADIATLKAIFSKHPSTRPYAEKLEQLFVKNKLMNAAYAHTKSSYKSFGLNLLHMPPHFYRYSLMCCNERADETGAAIISATGALLPIYELAYYRRMTRYALGLTVQEVGDAIRYSEGAIQHAEDPERYNRLSNDFYNKLDGYYEQKHAEWLAAGEALGETRTPFFDRDVLDALPILNNEEILEKWQQDDPELFARIERNVAFNTKIAKERGYESHRKKPEPDVEAETVTGEGRAADDVVEKEL